MEKTISDNLISLMTANNFYSESFVLGYLAPSEYVSKAKALCEDVE